MGREGGSVPGTCLSPAPLGLQQDENVALVLVVGRGSVLAEQGSLPALWGCVEGFCVQGSSHCAPVECQTPLSWAQGSCQGPHVRLCLQCSAVPACGSSLSVITAPFVSPSPGVSLLQRGVSLRFSTCSYSSASTPSALGFPNLRVYNFCSEILSLTPSALLSFLYFLYRSWIICGGEFTEAPPDFLQLQQLGGQSKLGCGMCCVDGNPMAQVLPRAGSAWHQGALDTDSGVASSSLSAPSSVFTYC